MSRAKLLSKIFIPLHNDYTIRITEGNQDEVSFILTKKNNPNNKTKIIVERNNTILLNAYFIHVSNENNERIKTMFVKENKYGEFTIKTNRHNRVP